MLAYITGGIAEAFYKEIPKSIVNEMWQRLPDDFKEIIHNMEKVSTYMLPQ